MPISSGSETRQRLIKGAQLFAKTVGVTYGPHGRNCLLDRMAGLLSTKDGVTVAREINTDDPISNSGCQILKAACVQVNDDAGDGTTTTAIIASKILEEGLKLVEAGHDPQQINRELQKAAQRAIDSLTDQRQEVVDFDLLKHVALIASNGDQEVADAMAEATLAAGDQGTISIEDGHGREINIVFKDGMTFEKGLASPHFLQDEMERSIDEPIVAIVGGMLKKASDVQDIMEVASQWKGRSLIVFAEHIEGEALNMMTINDQQNIIPCVAINAPGFQFRKKDYLKDIAALAGAEYIDPSLSDIGMWSREWFGALQKATVTAQEVSLVAYEDMEDLIQARIKEIEAEARAAVSEYDSDRCHERIAKLSGGLVVLEVGGTTEAEMKERKARIEDSLNAVRSSLSGGVLPGGGNAYLYCASHLEGEDVGTMILKEALWQPHRVLREKAGFEHAEDVVGGWVGWDPSQNKIRLLSAAPYLIDPAPVVEAAIRVAASAAGTLLTCEAMIY